jgi:hypothetical protein
MADDGIPAELRDFIIKSIDSVGQLEALLLLRADPLASWSSDAMAARLYIDEPSASRLLTDLQARHLARHEGSHWRFDAHDAEIARIVDRLAGVYARHVVEVAELIHSTSDRKAQRFADAFRWRKET